MSTLTSHTLLRVKMILDVPRPSFGELSRGESYVFLVDITTQKILCTKGGNKDAWSVPFGKIEKGETPALGVKVCLFKEFGLVTKNGNWDSPLILCSSGGVIRYYFVCTEWGGNIKKTKKYNTIEWFDLQKLPQDIIPHIRTAIEKTFAYK